MFVYELFDASNDEVIIKILIMISNKLTKIASFYQTFLHYDINVLLIHYISLCLCII